LFELKNSLESTMAFFAVKKPEYRVFWQDDIRFQTSNHFESPCSNVQNTLSLFSSINQLQRFAIIREFSTL
jgi:hypothetical protein